ncbi:MAG: hypothetical protein KDB03_12225 [Planctomycetales bacterium]|nr:hypothetical protein [Planctomycetales bacterium]
MSENSTQQWFNLENRFFAEVDQKLIEKMRESVRHADQAKAIMQLTGITSQALADEIAALNITPDTLAAFRLAPLVVIGWADDRMEENERYAILLAAEQAGIRKDSPAMEVLQTWTSRRPNEDLFHAWCDYAKSLARSLNEAQRETLRLETLRHAKDVAKAAGGVLMFGSVSASEARVLEQIEAALS